jgi:hypothetical protein
LVCKYRPDPAWFQQDTLEVAVVAVEEVAGAEAGAAEAVEVAEVVEEEVAVEEEVEAAEASLFLCNYRPDLAWFQQDTLPAGLLLCKYRCPDLARIQQDTLLAEG